MAKKKDFKMPTRVKMSGRVSSVTNAAVNGIIPCINPTDDDISKAIDTLGMQPGNVKCAYCGGECTEWDHFHPLIKDKEPTGYISEIGNLVPACSKCNQSKGNMDWKDFMETEKMKSKEGWEERLKKLEKYEETIPAHKYNLKEIVDEVDKDVWGVHMNNLKEIVKKMQDSQDTSNKIQKILDEKIRVDLERKN